MEKVTKNGREILTEITQNFQNSAQKDIQNLLDEILDKVSNANGLIAEKCFGKMGQQKAKANEAIANGNAIEEELSGELARHELSRMGSKVIKDTMFNYYQENLIAKSKVYKWWIRYR
ncbi:hypothetical protein niasHT_033527 [Heterodera trifolii]|uniref:Uncharacterized protein n=1 Tax=Heterodera trifolii TaxID=157864 RepID=A0ABD2J2U2_9BILA